MSFWKQIIQKKSNKNPRKPYYRCNNCGESCRYDRLKNHKCLGHAQKGWSPIDEVLLARLLELIVGLRSPINRDFILYLLYWV
jgi:hypothetical protein